ncbi:hypothetical protein Holit_00248 [Hollandina sp. SP2]
MEKAATIEDVMAIIDRMSQEIKAMAQETDKQMRETDKQIKETDKQIKETNKQIKETNKKIGALGGRLGEIVEYISAPHLEEKFKRFGIFLDTFIMEHTFEEPGKGIIAEVDIFLSNGDYVVAVEAKAKPKTEDIDDHIERMKKLRAYADRHNDPRKYIGAIAGMVVSDSVKGYAFKQGFPVLVPSGESMELECPSGFVPKEW